MNDSSRIATLVLRVAVSACAIGTAYTGIEYGGPVFSFFWLELDWSEAAAEKLVLTGSIATLLAAVGIWFRRLSVPAAIILALWLVTECAALVYARPPHPVTIPFARAARICAPLCIAFLAAGALPRRLLSLAAAATFTAHGLEALWYEPAFVDYLVIAGRDLLGTEPELTTIHGALIAIGVVDILAAATILFGLKEDPRCVRAVRIAAGYMLAWGLITAGARLVHSGTGASEDFAIRLPNAAVPAAAFLLFGTRRAPR